MFKVVRLLGRSLRVAIAPDVPGHVSNGCVARIRRLRLSLFEKAILANSLMLIGEALAGLWVTSHNIEAHHYLIDTMFIVLATLLGMLVNALLLRVSFRPLFSLLNTIRAVSAGAIDTRAVTSPSDSEIAELARAFNGMLDRLEAARREQGVVILQAQEEERRRVALELHDESGQNLTALLVHAEILSQSLQALPDTAMTAASREQLEEGLRTLSRLTERTLEDIRRLSQQLRPSVLDDLGLVAALRWLVQDGRERLRLAVELQMEGLEDGSSGDGGDEQRRQNLPTVYETAVFRIAQESLTNVARHAQAQHVRMLLRRDEEYVCLEVADDGCGFDVGRGQRGLGILGMRERAGLLGGTVTIHSRPGEGTRVQAVLPLAHASAMKRPLPPGKEGEDG